MQTIELQVHPIRDGEKATGLVVVERRQGDAWIRVREWDVSSADKSAYRKVVIEDDQRLIVEPRPATEVVYDRETFRAKEVPLDAAKRAEVEKEEVDVKAENVEVQKKVEEGEIDPITMKPTKTVQPRTSDGITRTGLRDSKDVKGEAPSPKPAGPSFGGPKR